jgi:hypothetical protein
MLMQLPGFTDMVKLRGRVAAHHQAACSLLWSEGCLHLLIAAWSCQATYDLQKDLLVALPLQHLQSFYWHCFLFVLPFPPSHNSRLAFTQ